MFQRLENAQYNWLFKFFFLIRKKKKKSLSFIIHFFYSPAPGERPIQLAAGARFPPPRGQPQAALHGLLPRTGPTHRNYTFKTQF